MCRACAGLEIWAKNRVKKGEVASTQCFQSAFKGCPKIKFLKPRKQFEILAYIYSPLHSKVGSLKAALIWRMI